jgi:hypothetical protein
MFEFQVCILPSIEEAIIMKENRPATPSGQSTNLTTRKSIPPSRTLPWQTDYGNALPML